MNYRTNMPNSFSEMGMDYFIFSKFNKVYQLCSELDIIELYFFGSSTGRLFIIGKSDIDIYVVIDKSKIKNLTKLEKGLKDIYNCNIDTFCSHWKLHSELNKFITANKVLVYKEEKRY